MPNRHALLDQHPAIAGQLQAFFADVDRMDRHRFPAEKCRRTRCHQRHRRIRTRRPTHHPLLRRLRIARGNRARRDGHQRLQSPPDIAEDRIVALKMIMILREHSLHLSRYFQQLRPWRGRISRQPLDHPHIVPDLPRSRRARRPAILLDEVRGGHIAGEAPADRRALRDHPLPRGRPRAFTTPTSTPCSTGT